jgi:RNA polymerase sigma-70 factor (ECF subfamily)
MADSVTTRPSLLARIKDTGDRQAWAEFVDIYAPLIYGFAHKQGLQDADAADLTQEVLGAVARSAARLDYDPARGTFRSWLFRVVRNELSDLVAAKRRHQVGSGDTDMKRRLEAKPAPTAAEAADWESDYERQLFALACEQVRRDFQESTWQAFWLTAIRGKSGKEVAGFLGITTAAVYLAKRRVIARLRQQIDHLREVDGE